MKDKEGETFAAWLARQAGREDGVGRLARDVATEEKRIGHPLTTTVNERWRLVLYVRGIPKDIGVTADDAHLAWAEWLESQKGIPR